jgi:predicted amidohydrolase
MWRKLKLSFLILSVSFLFAAGSGRDVDKASAAPALVPASATRPAAAPKTLRAAAVQMRSGADVAANISSIRRHLEKCKSDGVRVAVFPECALTGYLAPAEMRKITAEQLADAERQVCAICRALEMYAIIGTPTRDGERLLNSAIVIDPRGKVIERYHKVQLAENWPEAGDHLSVFPIDGVPCSIIICHDERYPELVRLPVLAGARVVFYVSHESGICQEKKIDPYRAQIQARAMENTVFVVHANAPANQDLTGSHGQSRVITPDGRIVQEASMFDEEVVTATLELRKATAVIALNSIKRGPLGDWWKEGVKRVRVVE